MVRDGGPKVLSKKGRWRKEGEERRERERERKDGRLRRGAEVSIDSDSAS